MMGHAGNVTRHFPVSDLIPLPLCYSHLLFFVVCNAVLSPPQVSQMTNHEMFVGIDSDIIQSSPGSRVSVMSSQQGPPLPSHREPESKREQHKEHWGEQITKSRCL